MASVTTTAFQNGATVNAYPASNWSQAQLPPSGSPVGSSAGSGTVAGGTVTIAGLTPSAAYFLHDGTTYVRATATPDLGLPGLIGPDDALPGWVTAAIALTSGTVFAYRIVPKRDYRIVNAKLPVSVVSGTDDPLEIAIFDSTLATKLATTGALTGRLNTLTPAVMPLAVTLEKGKTYYVAVMGLSAATVAFVNLITFRFSPSLGSSGGAPPLQPLVNKTGATHPLTPAMLASPNVSGTAPLVHLSEVA